MLNDYSFKCVNHGSVFLNFPCPYPGITPVLSQLLTKEDISAKSLESSDFVIYTLFYFNAFFNVNKNFNTS